MDMTKAMTKEMTKDTGPLTAHQLMTVLRETMTGTVRRDETDLSARQFAIMLNCYLNEGPHTVRGLAAELNISKPAVTRSLDRLELLRIAKRGSDPRDGRSIVVLRTKEGAGFMADLRDLMAEGQKVSTGTAEH